MPHRQFLIALSVVLLLGSSCSKRAQDTPAPAAEVWTGPSITGLIQPADALSGVSLADNITQQTIVSTSPDSKGIYRFDAVPAGTYMLYFNSKYGYVRPRQLSVSVTAGKTSVVPTVAVIKSTASFIADGKVFNPSLVWLSIGFDGKIPPSPGIFSAVLSDEEFGLKQATYQLYLSMPYAVAKGTYALNGASAYAIFSETNKGIFDSRLNPSTVSSPGTLTITAVENKAPFPRSVSGTFSFTGTDPALGTQKTFSGSFDNAYF
ncbi:carboxypeptidase regulatory-like domain-containing protein [Hymenobacter sp. BT523]|uniref:DUF6252 family protein n=1 Tax=Hymenobacter sp. BT523 TaxID=2795725 RepID=UPI0018EB8FF1|nr:DUF6252 family protein [Hymenobacter sp. BT523]MBJ6108934.1 carboxypeptidase regulatory-like domain-containing protein [Hymenobacter sp. BT523]